MTDFDKFEQFQGLKLRRKVRAVICSSEGRYLLIQPHSYQDHAWSFVGGGIEPGETPTEAIQRELREEVGIDKTISLSAASERPWYRFSEKIKAARKADYDGQIATLFLVIVPADTSVRIQVAEIKAYRWATLGEVRKLVTVPEQLEWFEAVLREFSTQEEAA